MEATGVYWKPVWHVLEGHVTLVLANAMHIRNIPGRKSDKNDATWIADLLALGLIRSSFGTPAPLQDLRDLTRTLTSGRLKATRAELVAALHGRVTPHALAAQDAHAVQLAAVEQHLAEGEVVGGVAHDAADPQRTSGRWRAVRVGHRRAWDAEPAQRHPARRVSGGGGRCAVWVFALGD